MRLMIIRNFLVPKINGVPIQASDVFCPVEPQTDTTQLVISSVNLEVTG